MSKKKLVIVGAGFAGVNTYVSIPNRWKNKFDITLINKDNYFLFTPLIHEVATGSIDRHNVVEPLRWLLDNRHTRFIQSEANKINTQTKEISLTRGGKITYDYLVLAIGAEINFFNIPGASKYSLNLKTLTDATELKNRLINVFEEEMVKKTKSKKDDDIVFSIIGGGPTGVEIAAEISDYCYGTLSRLYPNISIEDRLKIYIFNRGSNLLPGFPLELSTKAEKELLRKKVIVKNNSPVTEIYRDRVFAKKEIKTNLVVWTAGVKPVNIQILPQPKMIAGRIVTDKFMRLENMDDVFVLGDISHFPTDDHKGLPMLAQVASQQGITMGHNLIRIAKGKKIKEFKFIRKGYLVSLGRWSAVAKIFNVRFYGFIAWFVWRTIYLFNFASWPKRLKIMLDWTVNLFSNRDVTKD